MIEDAQKDSLSSAIDSFERGEYSRAIALLEPLEKLGSTKAKTYLSEIYWRVTKFKNLKRACQLQKELNEIYDHQSIAYEIGAFRETLMLFEASNPDDNARLNLLFIFLSNSSRDQNLLLAASIAKSDRIIQSSVAKPLVLYFRAIRCASSFTQKLRILGLIFIELIYSTKKSIVIYPQPIE